MVRIFNKIIKLLLPPLLYARYIGIKYGSNCRIASKNWSSEPYLIELGDHVHITYGVNFITHDGAVWAYRQEIPDFDVFGKIKIGDNTYIGSNATIMPGVTIGKNCIIGAGSLVTKSIPDNCVVAGVPARFITSIEQLKDKLIKYNAKTKFLSPKQKQKTLQNDSSIVFQQKDYLT